MPPADAGCRPPNRVADPAADANRHRRQFWTSGPTISGLRSTVGLSPAQHRTLAAVAEAALPAGRFVPAAGESTVNKVEQFLGELPLALQRGVAGLLHALDGSAWLSGRRSFAQLPIARRLAMLDGWRTSDPVRRLLLRALVSPLKM